MVSLPDLDYDTALANLAGMAELYREALQTFWLEGPALMAQYRAGWDAGDWAEARRAAHSLKSAAAVLGASRLSQAARELEWLARDAVSEPDRALPAWAACEAAWQDFQTAARPYLSA